MQKKMELFKVLADTSRLKVLMLLSQQEMAVCELIEALDLSQPAVSHHLRLLKQSGLVQDNREGKWVFYTINEANLQLQIKALEEFFQEVDLNLKQGVKPSLIRDEPCLCEKLKFNDSGRPHDPIK